MSAHAFYPIILATLGMFISQEARGDDLKGLVYYQSAFPSDAITGLEDPAEQVARERRFAEELKRFPDAAARITDMALSNLRNDEGESLSRALFALGHLQKVPNDCLNRISAEMARLAALSEKPSFAEENMLICGAHVLKQYPNPAHEELAVAMLQSKGTSVVVGGLHILAAYGRPEFLEDARAAVERRKTLSAGKIDLTRDHMVGLLEQFEARAAKQLGSGLSAVPPQRHNTSGVEKRPNSASEEDRKVAKRENWMSIAWGVVAVGLAGIMWLVVKSATRCRRNGAADDS